jgi:hypothetical protein
VLDDGAGYGVAMQAADHGQDVQRRFCHAAKVTNALNESTNAGKPRTRWRASCPNNTDVGRTGAQPPFRSAKTLPFYLTYHPTLHVQ